MNALQEKIDKMQVLVQEQENRIVKLEHQSEVSVDDMKKGKLMVNAANFVSLIKDRLLISIFSPIGSIGDVK